MEIGLIGLISYLGYQYNNKSKEKTNDFQPKNIFESRRSLTTLQNEFKLADSVYKQKYRVYPGPPKIPDDVRYMKVDYKNTTLPIEFNSSPIGNLFADIDTKNPPIRVDETKTPPRVPYSSNNNVAGSWHGISLTGEPIEPKTFSHNNLVPFFGGKVRQSMDEKAYSSIIESYTGNSIESYKEKTEQGPFFQPAANMTNPYLMSSITSFEQDRYIPSKIINNVAPVEPVLVGPGLNMGYTSIPSGGYQQANGRDYQLPKTVDELRVLTNPKLTFYGRVLSGLKGVKPGKIGTVEKRNPDSFYINSPERYFTTVGQQTAPRMRPNVVLKPTHRRKTATKNYLGPSKLAVGGKQPLRSKYRKSCKQTYTYGYRNLDASGEWNGEGYDYGKRNIIRRPTGRRDQTAKNDHLGIAYENTEGELRNNQKAKTTIRQQTEDNDDFGELTGTPHGYVYDPNDIAKTTVKETTEDNEYTGSLDASKNSYVMDPNDIAKTTVKETTLDGDYVGNPNLSKKSYLNKGQKAKTTIRETNEFSYAGNPQQESKKGTLRNQQVRNTLRQFYCREVMGNAGAVNGEKQPNRDAICNSTSKALRSFQDKGYTPGMGSNISAHLNHTVNATTKKTNEITDKYINERGLASDRVINSIPAPIPSAVTKDRTNLNNDVLADRLDLSILDQFRMNPYTQSLHSYAWP